MSRGSPSRVDMETSSLALAADEASEGVEIGFVQSRGVPRARE